MAELLKMSQLAERSGVSAATIKHYVREGLLPEPVRTSRNMAYYPPGFVDRIRQIKRLQEEDFLPLKVIRERLASARILDEAVAAGERLAVRVPAAEVTGLPPRVLERLAEIGVLTPTDEGYDPDDLRIIDAMRRFRAGGYDESLGFTVHETLRYKQALEPLVRDEVRLLLERLSGDVEPGRVAAVVEAGAEPLRELIGAMHSKLLLAELRAQRG